LGKDLVAKAKIEMVSESDLESLGTLEEKALHQLAIAHADAVSYQESVVEAYPHADPAIPHAVFSYGNLVEAHQGLYQNILQAVSETVNS
jgi:hypothetical protein